MTERVIDQQNVRELYYHKASTYMVVVTTDGKLIGGAISDAAMIDLVAYKGFTALGTVEATLPEAGFRTATSFVHYGIRRPAHTHRPRHISRP